MSKRASLLPVVGAIALSAYILACRPGFSPDGSRVVYSVLDEESESFRIVVYDLEKKKNATLHVGQRTREKESGAATLWSADGKSVVAAWVDADEDQLIHVFTLPLDKPARKRHFRVRTEDDAVISVVYPIVSREHHLFFGGKRVQRLDLRTGKIKASEEEMDTVLARGDDAIHCLAMNEASKEFEIGRLDPETLKREVVVRTKGDLSPFFAVSEDGKRYAVAHEKGPLEIYRGGKKTKSVPLPAKGEFGSLVWTSDEKTVYMVHYLEKQLQVLKIEIESGSVSPIPLFKGGENDKTRLLFQLDLSPDGKTLAGASTSIESSKIKPEDRVLWLIDISGKDPKITRVAPPKP